MPSRIIREGICASETINELTSDQEVFFYRLLVVVDDFGRFDGRQAIVKSACFPLRDTLSAKQIEAWLAALERTTLIRRYAVDGKPFLVVSKWDQHQRMRQARSKYPPPPDESTQSASSRGDPPQVADNPPQVAADCGSRAQPRAAAESESESESESERNPKPSRAAPAGVRDEVWQAWQRHRGKRLSVDAVRLQSAKLTELARHGHDPNAVLEQSIANGWSGLFPLGKATGPPRHRQDKRSATAKAMYAHREQSDARPDDAIDGTAERLA